MLWSIAEDAGHAPYSGTCRDMFLLSRDYTVLFCVGDMQNIPAGAVSPANSFPYTVTVIFLFLDNVLYQL